MSDEGIIEWLEKEVVDGSELEKIALGHGVVVGDHGVEVVELADGDFLSPGLIDTHTVGATSPSVLATCSEMERSRAALLR